jgi:hypothetical protein
MEGKVSRRVALPTWLPMRAVRPIDFQDIYMGLVERISRSIHPQHIPLVLVLVRCSTSSPPELLQNLTW